jgi:hypothetical protein
MDALGNVRSEDDQHALRRHFIAVMKSVKRAQAAAYAAGMEYTDPGFPRWPDMSTFSILRCGAKTKRHGTPLFADCDLCQRPLQIPWRLEHRPEDSRRQDQGRTKRPPTAGGVGLTTPDRSGPLRDGGGQSLGDGGRVTACALTRRLFPLSAPFQQTSGGRGCCPNGWCARSLPAGWAAGGCDLWVGADRHSLHTGAAAVAAGIPGALAARWLMLVARSSRPTIRLWLTQWRRRKMWLLIVRIRQARGSACSVVYGQDFDLCRSERDHSRQC